MVQPLWTYFASPESNSYALQARSIEYLWVTGLRNSV